MRIWVVLVIAVLNVSLAGCAAALLGNASRGGYYGGGADTRTQAQISQDGALSAAVKSKLNAEASLKSQPVVVAASYSVVTLSGTVQKAEQRATAERLARQVKGVKSVRNELKLR